MMADAPNPIWVLPDGEGPIHPFGGPADQVSAWNAPTLSVIALPATGVPKPIGVPALLWSGSGAQVDISPALAAAELFNPDPRTWGTVGWNALTNALKRIEPPPPVIRTHARHVVSDIPGIRRIIAPQGEPIHARVLIDPAGMLTPLYARSALGVDQLTRIYEFVRDIVAAVPDVAPKIFGVVVSGVAVSPKDYCKPCPLDEGVIPGATIAAIAKKTLPPGIPILLPETKATESAAILAQAS